MFLNLPLRSSEYQLRFVMQPFSFLKVLDNFGFEVYINILFTIIIAVFVAIVVFVLRMYGKAHTVVIPRPALAVDLYFKNIVVPALSGVFLFTVPLFSILLILMVREAKRAKLIGNSFFSVLSLIFVSF